MNQNNLFNNNNLFDNNNNNINNNKKRLFQSKSCNFNGRNIIEKNGTSNFLSISSTNEFYELSLEELRLNDYIFFKTGNIPPQPVFNRNNIFNKYINNNLNQNQNSFLEIIIIQIYFLLILIIILSFYLIIIIIYQEMACFLITIVEIMEIILCLEIIVIIL